MHQVERGMFKKTIDRVLVIRRMQAFANAARRGDAGNFATRTSSEITAPGKFSPCMGL